MRRPVLVRRLALSTTALALVAVVDSPGQAATCTWNGGAGDWSIAASWSCNQVPGDGDMVQIDGKPGTTSIVAITGGQNAGTVTLDGGDTLTILNGSLGVSGGSFVNNGTVTLNSSSQLIGTAGNLMLTGNGTVTLADIGTGGAYLYAYNGRQLTIGGGQTVMGTGYIGNDQGLVSNAGTIDATGAGGPPGLVLNSQGGSGGIGAGNGLGVNTSSSFYNTGTLEATGGGLLRFQSGTYENGGTGQIVASGHDALNNGSVVALENDVRIIGGTLTSSGGGAIQAIGNGTQFLQDTTLSGGSTLAITNDTVRIDNSLANNGTITVGTSAALIGETGSVALTGTGTIVLNDTGSGGAYLYDYNGTQMTIGSGQTVMGTGYVGNDQGVITNNGVIDATSTQGPPGLVLNAQGGSGGIGAGNGVGTNGASAFYNAGTLEATGGGLLRFQSGLYENGANGQINAIGTGSVVSLENDVRIIGGALTSSDGGSFAAVNNGTQFLQGVVMTNGTSLAITNDTVRIDNSLANNGTITVGTSAALIGETGSVALTGTGTIVLNDTGSGGAYLYDYNGTQMTIGSGQTVMGTGYVGNDQGVITNNGVIDATSTQGPPGLVLNAQGGSGGIGAGNGVGTNGASAFYNAGTLEATGGGLLRFQSGLYENGANGQINAIGTGSVVSLENDVRIIGGALTSGGGGTFLATNNGTQFLQDTALTNGTTLAVAADTVRLDNTLTNNGTITVGTSGVLVGETAASTGQPGGTTLAGTGSIILNGDGSAVLYDYNGTQLTIGGGQTVTGIGSVGNDQGVIVNNGVIDATGTGGAPGLVLNAQGGSGGIGANNGVGTNGNSAFYNTNTLEATGGGLLRFQSGLYENSANGQIAAVGTGSVVSLENDVRIIGGTLSSSGGGMIVANGNGTQFFQDTAIAAGSNLAVTNDTIRIDNTLTNNGAITVNAGGTLLGETATSTLAGGGTVVLADANSAVLYDYNGTLMTIGAGQTVRGSGQIGADQGVIDNRGNILADGSITINAQGGNGGIGAGNGLGVGTNVAFYNDNGGQVQANNGGATLTLAAGSYEQAAGGSFSVGTGSTFTMGNDSSLANLQGGGVLNKGLYFAFAGGTMTLASNQTGSIATIGTAHAGTDTVVTLSGANSVIQVVPSGGGTPVTIDQSLQSVAQSGKLVIEDGRSFTAQNGAFANAGTLALANGGTFAAPAGFANSGMVIGNGTVGSPITNSGIVVADGGTLNAMAITGSAGTIQSNAGATLSLAGAAGPSTAGFLVNNGMLALGGNNVTVTSDYQNAHFGTGSGFDAHADVTGSGLILAASATQDLSGAGLSGNTLNVGNVRTGESSSTTLTITNNGTLTTLRGAIESPVGGTVSISSDQFVVGPHGSTSVTLSFTGMAAGSLAGQTITVANNFDNVADQTLNIQGAAYNEAQAMLSPNPIDLGATRTGGTLSGTVTIANVAPANGYSESLAVNGASGSGGASGTTPGGLIAAGSSAASTVMLNTATSGTKSGTVTYALATDGTGTSGLAQAALPSQSVTVNGKVYQVADPQLASHAVTFATVRQGSAAPTASVGLANAANGALNDSLQTQVTSSPPGVTTTAPGTLAGGQSGAVAFSENTGTAGVFSGTAQLGFTSTDPDLAPLALPGQSVSVGGTVTQLAVAQLLKNGGAGTFTGSGNSYTLDLGTIAAGSGSVSTDLAVLNAIMNTAYGEKLGGSFGSSGGTGYTFAGMTFSGLSGGSEDIGNLLTFNYAGLGNGIYSDMLTLTDYSSYAGLSDMALAPIHVTVTAQIAGAGGGTPPAVPEPTTWLMLVFGFGALGAAMRRRRTVEVAA